ncbi:uncharacterized protein J3R85_009515, partial [Psidium guajava]
GGRRSINGPHGGQSGHRKRAQDAQLPSDKACQGGGSVRGDTSTMEEALRIFTE